MQIANPRAESIDPSDDDTGGDIPSFSPAPAANDGDAGSSAPAPAAPDTTEHQATWLDRPDALTQTGTALAQMPADLSTKLEDAKQQAGPSAAGFTGLALNTFDEYHQQASESLPPEARSTFTLAAKPYRDFIGQGALQYEAKQRLDWRAGQYTQSADTWADQVARSPALLPLADTALRATQPRLNPEQNTMLGEYARDKLVQSGVAGALAQDPAGLLKALGGSTAMPGTNDPDTQPQPGDIDLDHPLVKLMTPSEREHYREVARITVLQQQATQREDLKGRTADATQSYLDTGTAKNPPSLSDMVNAFGQEEGSSRYRQMQDAAMLGQNKQRMLPLPQSELSRLRNQVPAEDDAQGQRNYKALTGAIDGIEQERRTDSMGFALKTNSYGLTPIKDFSDTNALAAELGKRQRANGTLRADYGTEPTVLSKEENAQLTQTLKTLPGDKQAALLVQIAQGLNDPQMMDTAMRGISANAPVQALAGLSIANDYAGSEDEEMGHLPLGGNGRISAGQTMLIGEAARNPPPDQPDAKPLAMPPDGQTRNSYTSIVGDRFVDQPGAEEAHYQAALAAYAGLSKQAGGSSGQFDEQRWNAAVNLAVNGSGTAREIGLVPQGQSDGARIQQMRNTFADASGSMRPGSDGDGQLLAGSAPSSESASAPDGGGLPTGQNAAPDPDIDTTKIPPDAETSPSIGTVGKEGAKGAWGIAAQLAGPGASKEQINRTKNQLLFLNPELAGAVNQGQRYYVPTQDTPENIDAARQADTRWQSIQDRLKAERDAAENSAQNDRELNRLPARGPANPSGTIPDVVTPPSSTSDGGATVVAQAPEHGLRSQATSDQLYASKKEGEVLGRQEKAITLELAQMHEDAEQGKPIDKQRQEKLQSDLRVNQRLSRTWNSQRLDLLWETREHKGGLNPSEEEELYQRQAISVLPGMQALVFGPPKGPKAGGNAAVRAEEIGGTGGKALGPDARRQTMRAEEESGVPPNGKYIEMDKHFDTVPDADLAKATDKNVLGQLETDHVHEGNVRDRMKNGRVVLDANGNPKKAATGGHSLNRGTVKIIGPETPVGTKGVYTAPIEIQDQSTGQWYGKTNQSNNMSSMYPKHWTEARIDYEASEAFRTSPQFGQSAPPGGAIPWEGTSPSGVKIKGKITRDGVTHYPSEIQN